jgi:ABC-type transporter Mla subunit MlaD
MAPAGTTADNMPIINSESSGFDRLFDGASNSMKRLDALLNDESIKHINATFVNLDRMSGRIDALLNAHQASINRLLGPDLDELAETIHAFHKTLDSITALANSLNDNPSQIIFPNHPKSVRIDP